MHFKGCSKKHYISKSNNIKFPKSYATAVSIPTIIYKSHQTSFKYLKQCGIIPIGQSSILLIDFSLVEEHTHQHLHKIIVPPNLSGVRLEGHE